MIVHEFPYDAKLRLKRRSEMIPCHLSILDPKDTNTGTTPGSSLYSKNRPDCSSKPLRCGFCFKYLQSSQQRSVLLWEQLQVLVTVVRRAFQTYLGAGASR